MWGESGAEIIIQDLVRVKRSSQKEFAKRIEANKKYKGNLKDGEFVPLFPLVLPLAWPMIRILPRRLSLHRGYLSHGGGSGEAVGEIKRRRREMGSSTIVSMKTNANK